MLIVVILNVIMPSVIGACKGGQLYSVITFI